MMEFMLHVIGNYIFKKGTSKKIVILMLSVIRQTRIIPGYKISPTESFPVMSARHQAVGLARSR